MKPRTVAIAGGKGGVGKTQITAGLAVASAQRLLGSGRVAALDLDLGAGNLNTCLGVAQPKGSINDFLADRVDSLDPLWNPTALRNLDVISGSYSGSERLRLEERGLSRLFQALASSKARAAFLDLGAGTASELLDCFLKSDERIVVLVPESLSLHNAFLFLKSAIFQHLDHELAREDFLSPIRRKLGEIVADGTLNLPQVLERLKEWDRYSSYIVSGLVAELRVNWLANMFRGGDEERFLRRFATMLERHLCLNGNSRFLGTIGYDEGVVLATRRIRPFCLDYPDSGVAASLRRISEELLPVQD